MIWGGNQIIRGIKKLKNYHFATPEEIIDLAKNYLLMLNYPLNDWRGMDIFMIPN